MNTFLAENFNYISYSNQSEFAFSSDGKINLAQYSSDLVFYTPFDANLNAKYSAGSPTGTSSGTITIDNFGVFGQFANLKANGQIIWDHTSFDGMTSTGTINFRLHSGFNNDPGRQDFLANTVSPADTIYSFQLGVGYHMYNLSISVSYSDTVGTISNKLYSLLNPTYSASTAILPGDYIRLHALNNGDSCFVLPPTSGNSLLALLGGVEEMVIPNSPTADSINFFKLWNGTDNSNSIVLTQTGDSSHLKLKMYDSSGVLKVNTDFGIWSNNYNRWYDFEITWNNTIAQFFIDGTLVGVVTTGFDRGSATALYLQSGAADFYEFDELIVYNTQHHSANFTVPTTALSAYPTNNPYIDIALGTCPALNTVQNLNLICSTNTYFVVKIGNIWYYYIAGTWQVSDGSFSQSVTPTLLQTQFTALPFNQNLNITIRVYFHSDGTYNVWLSSVEIVIIPNQAIPATITGMMNLSGTTNMSAQYNVSITTNLGGGQVNCKYGAADSINVLLNEIKSAIAFANIQGLATPSDDGTHLVLSTSTYGDSAWVSIDSGSTNDALAIIFGGAASAVGTTPGGEVIDYSELFRYVRAKLGEPTLPVELTDEQLMDALADATFWYDRWRNFKEEVLYVRLNGNGHDGYQIPPVVGDPANIMEIIVQSRYPYSFYAGKADDIIGNLYVQSIFHKWKSAGLLSDILSDYYLVVSTAEDINILLGSQIKWEIFNGRLFLYPQPPVTLNVGIRYKSALSPQEVVTSWWIRRYVLAEAKIVLGNIRSTFKSGIPGGTEMITLNGEALIEEGKAEKEKIEEEMKKSAPPLMFEWF